MVLFTFDPAGGNHDEPPMVVVVVGVMDPHGNLADSHYLLHGHEYKFHRQEADTFIKEVQRAEENQVPLGRECRASGGDRPLRVPGGVEVLSRSPSPACWAWERVGQWTAVHSGPL